MKLAKAWRYVLSVLIVILVLVVVLVLVVHFFADRAVKYGVERAGTQALDVSVKVDQAKMSILGGSVQLEEIAIHNPEGYETPFLMTLDDIYVKADVASMLSDTVEIRNLRLTGGTLMIEQKALANNLQQVIKNIQKQTPKEPPTEPTETKNLRIDELEIADTVVQVKLLPIPGQAKDVELKLGTIRMTDLGTEDKLSLAELVSRILLAIAAGVTEQGQDLLPQEMLGSMREVLLQSGDLLETGREVLQQGTEALEKGAGEILKQGEDVGKQVEESLKGILGPRKQQQ